MRPRRIVLLSTGAGLGPPVLSALRHAGHEVAALVTPGRLPRRLPPRRVLLAADVADAAQAAGIPVVEAPRGTAGDALLDELRPDLVVVACFPWRLSEPWWTKPPLGAVNVHPSLLPAWRGPAPLFWQFREGATRTGVTVHRMDAGLDTGPILAATPVLLPEGVRHVEAERTLGAAAAGLFLAALAGDTAWAGRAQPEEEASRQPWPDGAALDVDTSWDAARAFRFIRLAGGAWPLRLTAAGRRFCVRDAAAFTTGGQDAPLVATEEGGMAIRFAGGTVRFGRTDAHPL